MVTGDFVMFVENPLTTIASVQENNIDQNICNGALPNNEVSVFFFIIKTYPQLDRH